MTTAPSIALLAESIQVGTLVNKIVVYWIHTLNKHAIDIITAMLARKVLRSHVANGFLLLAEIELSIPLTYFDADNTTYTYDLLALLWGLICTVQPMSTGLGFLLAEHNRLSGAHRILAPIEKHMLTLGELASNYTIMSRYGICAMACTHSIAQQIIATGYQQLLQILQTREDITHCLEICLTGPWHISVDSTFALHLKRIIQTTQIYVCTTENPAHDANDFLIDNQIGCVLAQRDRILIVFCLLNNCYEFNYLALDATTRTQMGVPHQLSTSLKQEYPRLFTPSQVYT